MPKPIPTLSEADLRQANAYLEAHKSRTGQPLYVNQAYYDHFKALGIDMTHVVAYGPIDIDAAGPDTYQIVDVRRLEDGSILVTDEAAPYSRSSANLWDGTSLAFGNLCQALSRGVVTMEELRSALPPETNEKPWVAPRDWDTGKYRRPKKAKR